MAQLCCMCKWQVRFYSLEITGRPIVEISPGVVSVLRYELADMVYLWPQQRKHATRTKVGRRKHTQTLGKNTLGNDFASVLEEPQPSSGDSEGNDVSDAETVEGSDDESCGNEELMDLLEWTENLEPLDFAAKPSLPSVMAESKADLDEPGLVVAEPPGTQEAAASSTGVVTAPVVHAVSTGRLNQAADATYYYKGGKISYYSKKGIFEAVCGCAAHGKCVLTRGSAGRKSRTGQRMGGQPLGLMMKWLESAGDHIDKSLHFETALWTWTHAERVAARELLEQNAEGRKLMSFERPVAEGASKEPATLCGML
eukprot:6425933-Amphidinium_carterae.5